MGLVPNYWTESSVEIPVDEQADWTESLRTISSVSGYYRAPNQGTTKGRSSSGDDSILIEQTKSFMTRYDTEIRTDEEEWEYEVVNGPPMSYHRITKSAAYLPGLGRRLRKVEEEETEYFTFTPLTDGDNLGRIRRISALVVYTRPVDPTKAASQESKDKAEEANVKPGATEDRIVSTGKIWSEANYDGTVVPNASAPQYTIWVKNVIEEHDIIEEQADRWIKWTVTKNALRPGDVRVKGPIDIKKTAFVYQFPYPVEPPEIDAANASSAIKIEIKGGGASWITPYFRREVSIPADKYNIFRKKISEPTRDAEDDPYDRWETPPAADGPRGMLTNTVEEDFDGAPADPIPAATSYTEPHDVDPPEEDTETAFSMIATVDNVNVEKRHDRGYAEFLDEDIVATAEYEYYATAVISEAESPDSNHEIVTASNDGHHRMRMRLFDDGRGVDVLPPDDPASTPEDDYGEVVELEIPTEDIQEVWEDITERQFATSTPDFRVDIDVLYPLLGLEYGQEVEAPVVQWDAWANDIHTATETDADEWTLVGFTLRAEKAKDGSWKTQRTRITMQEMTR